jgi:hypothetical protein
MEVIKMNSVDKMIMSKGSDRKFELLKIRARRNRATNRKARIYAKNFAQGLFFGTLLYVIAIGIYVAR